MSPFARRAAALAVLLITAACADRPPPVEPPREAREPVAVSGTGTTPASPEQARHERLARRFALALRDDAFRATAYGALRGSRVREGKVHLQGFLNDGSRRARLAELTGEAESALTADLTGALPIEIYLPVPEHRRRWLGDANILVATAERDHDAPVAFDLSGRRQLLDPNQPPSVPVIALGRAETAFADAGGPAAITYDEDPGGGFVSGGTGGTGTTASPSPGLYMTYTTFNSTFEGWLKGDPEFEVHVLGQDGSTSAMKSYQCAGEKAGGPYAFDQNGKVWSGTVMLFSAAQLDAYQAAHPGQAVKILVVEDDDTACQIKTDSARVEKMLKQIVDTYGTLTGGKSDPLISVRTFTKAFSILSLFKSAWSVITTQDDVVGDAIEDSVAREFFPNANWIVKGENTITNGAIRLEMR
jgi:hypothetical protein